MKKLNKIFIARNELEEIRLRHDVTRAFELCKNAVELVKDFGIMPTPDIVRDCLTLRKAIQQKERTETTKWMGKNDVLLAREFEAVETFANDTHLRAELEKKLSDIDTSNARPATRTEKKNALVSEYKKMLDDIYRLFHTGRRTIETANLLRYVEVTEDGDVKLPDDFDERIVADTATYAKTERGIAAYHKHKEACACLDELSDLMKNASRDNFTTNLQNIFSVSDDGSLCPTPIDYDLYTN